MSSRIPAFASGALAMWVCCAATLGAPLQAVPVRYTEGVVHGFLVLKGLNDTPLADGDLLQTAAGDRVTSRLVFRFRDGSIQDETTIFSQSGHFKLISDRLLQRGASFPQPMDVMIELAGGRVTVRYTDDHGRQQTEHQQMDLPPTLANGLMLTLLKNVEPRGLPLSLPYVAATPKPRLVTLEVTAAGEDQFAIGGASRKVTHYVVHVKIGGLTGLLARVVGKVPPDRHVWVLGGDVPAFVKMEGPLYLGGPTWRIELVSPAGPR